MNLPTLRASQLRAAGAAALTIGTLAAGVPSAAFAAPSSPGDYTTKVVVKNRTSYELTLKHSQVIDGEWTQDPPYTISANGVGRMATASTEDEGGTGGTVTYSSDYGDVVIYWNDPDTYTDNEFTCDPPSGWTCLTQGSPDGQHPKMNVDIYE
ncbi:hypothetical protein Aph02nite_44920 [Actinoplanes philippinensis]|uniref:Crystal protein ET79 n=1 Tax=Actinoplanes philippinensis TaxID=35752 RepID=A0A1I2I8Z1_9ACTN|nr:hypothetical protein [Actinoplanes philippinensis]GIE78542.1 hypothetical protein Aph02nite_44920 [Actinoplanes philippinensis]SFF38123.1 hypothetical protein SAMN05421541_109385 [Actinoplanes philippinensis]